MKYSKLNISNDIWMPSDKKIKILNSEDFKIPKFILDICNKFGLDIETFGICDKDEIKNRLDIMHMLSNDEIISEISDFHNFFASSRELPPDENSFLHYYNNDDNIYWENLKRLIGVLSKYNKYDRIKCFTDKLKNFLQYEKVEKDFANEVSVKLNNVTFLEGILELNSYGDLSNSIVVGKKMYKSTWKDGYIAKAPKWTKTIPMKIIGASSIIQKSLNTIATNRSFKSSIITDLPTSILNDIISYLYSINFFYDRNLKYVIHFIYDNSGLFIDIVSSCRKYDKFKFKFKYEDYDGFTSQDKKRIKKHSKLISNQYEISRSIESATSIYDNLFSKYGIKVGTKFKIESKQTDEEFRWYALQNIYSENKEIVNKLEQIRNYTYNNMLMLYKLSKVYSYMKKLSIINKMNICIPTIVNSGTHFKELSPIEIIDKSYNLIPITLPSIDGHIVCLTGRHGGGKSITGKSILSSVWMAQSGLPIFAKEFKTELKSVIGSIVNDDGDGSTATIFVEKVKNLLEGINKVPKGESIIFIDEIGKGTQESAGINLGKRILKTLKNNGYNVIFNSQILQLAEYAKYELDAKCFVVNKDHQFIEGIGDGQMDQLLKEKGLDQLLSVEVI